MADTTILASVYSGWYNKINDIRTKHGASKITVVTPSGTITKAQMTTLQTAITNAKAVDSHMSSVASTIPTITTGNPILLSTKTSIDTILTNLYAKCHDNSANYTANYTSNQSSHRDHDNDDSYDCNDYNHTSYRSDDSGNKYQESGNWGYAG